MENFKESTKMPQKLSVFSKITGYKINIKKLYFYILTMNNWKSIF